MLTRLQPTCHGGCTMACWRAAGRAGWRLGGWAGAAIGQSRLCMLRALPRPALAAHRALRRPWPPPRPAAGQFNCLRSCSTMAPTSYPGLAAVEPPNASQSAIYRRESSAAAFPSLDGLTTLSELWQRSVTQFGELPALGRRPIKVGSSRSMIARGQPQHRPFRARQSEDAILIVIARRGPEPGAPRIAIAKRDQPGPPRSALLAPRRAHSHPAAPTPRAPAPPGRWQRRPL